MFQYAKRLQAQVTLEPVIFIIMLTEYIAKGVRQETNLQLEKICVDHFNLTRDECQNKSYPDGKDLESDIQKIYTMWDHLYT